MRGASAVASTQALAFGLTNRINEDVTLKDAQNLLHDLMRRLEPGSLALRQFGSSPSEIQQRFLDWEHATGVQVSAAAAEFAAEGSLPVLTPAESGMLYLRAMQAYDFADGLLAWEQHWAPETQLPEHDREELLSWLLLTYWDATGFGVVMGILEDVASGNRRAEDGNPSRN